MARAKPLSFSEKELFKQVKDILVEELAEALGVNRVKAEARLEACMAA